MLIKQFFKQWVLHMKIDLVLISICIICQCMANTNLFFMQCLIHAMIFNLAHIFEKIIFLHTKGQRNEEFNLMKGINRTYYNSFASSKEKSFHSIANHDCKIKFMHAIWTQTS